MNAGMAIAAGAGCPECGEDSWNNLGCVMCGLEFSPPSEAFWAASTLPVSMRVKRLRAIWIPVPGLTPAESCFWDACLGRDYPWTDDVLPQARIGPYRADFLLAETRIVIEIDGFSNHSSAADITHDRERQRWLQAQGYRVIRFSNPEVLRDPARCAADADALIRGGLR